MYCNTQDNTVTGNNTFVSLALSGHLMYDSQWGCRGSGFSTPIPIPFPQDLYGDPICIPIWGYLPILIQSTPVITKSDITKSDITKSFNGPEILLSYYIIKTSVRNGYNEIPLITKSFKSHIASNYSFYSGYKQMRL